MVLDLLLYAMEEKKKSLPGTGRRILRYSDRTFEEVANDLLHSIEHWPSKASSLLNPENWNLSRLIGPSGKFRKPHAQLVLEFTTKDNLVLEWYPGKPSLNYLAETDFIYWSPARYGSQDPENRIVMIHSMTHLKPYNAPFFPKPETMLVELVHHHINDIINSLCHTVDIKLLSNLYLEYLDDGSHYADRKLKDFTVLPAGEIERRRKDKRDAAWLKASFEDGLKISADEFLAIFIKAEKNSTKCSVLLAGKRIKAGKDRIKTLVSRLKQDFPEMYCRYCKDEQQEHKGSSGKVIPLRKP